MNWKEFVKKVENHLLEEEGLDLDIIEVEIYYIYFIEDISNIVVVSEELPNKVRIYID